MVLKIIKHCQEEGSGGSELVQGVLLGLVENKRLEVTNCFPFPRHTDEEDFDEGNSFIVDDDLHVIKDVMSLQDCIPVMFLTAFTVTCFFTYCKGC